MGRSLTDHGDINTLTLTTGHRRKRAIVPDAIKDLKPGTFIAIDMAVGAAPRNVLEVTRVADGVPRGALIGAKANRKGQIIANCTVADLSATLIQHDTTGKSHFVNGDHHRHAFVGQFNDNVENLFGHFGVQGGCGFIRLHRAQGADYEVKEGCKQIHFDKARDDR